ncbi:MAG TPA: hypothetical protein ENH82_20080 [bacterium]|nr:hypothetical protein [bacterium]
MAGLDYQTNLDAVMQALKDHNTTTASPDLSGSLTTRILQENIFADDPEIVFKKRRDFPSIFVRISNKDEDFSGIGAPGPLGVRKQADVTYDIIGIYGKDGGYTTHGGLLNEIYKMAQNIEAVFQAEHKLSNTALWVNPITTDFLGPFDIDGGWAKTVLVQLTARYHFR